tara:strand:+ start:30 stop:1295 length:1266 start_codon:yes stop_codon:yes gene_type:complete
MFKTDNNMFVFAASAISTTHALGIATPGVLLFLDETGTNEAAVAAGEKFRIVQYDADGNQRTTPMLKYDNYINVNNVAKSDRVNQLSVFGSTGDAGSIDAINSNRYTVRVIMKNNTDMFSEQSDQYFFEYVSDSSAKQVEIANHFAQQMSKVKAFAGGKDAKVKVERFSSATFTAINTDLATFTATQGSTAITFSAGTMTELSAGRYVRIHGGTTVQNSVVDVDDVGSDANEDPIYKIASVDSSNKIIYLDQPFQARSSALYQDVTMQVATAATVEAGNMGIRIMGKPQKFSVGLHTDTMVTFDVALDGWGDTTALATTASSKGVGHAREVAELEWFAHGAVGAPYRQGVPNNAHLISTTLGSLLPDAEITSDYNMTFVDAVLDDPYHAVAGSGKGRIQIVIAYSGTAGDISTHLPTRLIG